jgi:hypothetical protein
MTPSADLVGLADRLDAEAAAEKTMTTRTEALLTEAANELRALAGAEVGGDTFMGFKVVIDEKLTPGVVMFRDANGKAVGFIIEPDPPGSGRGGD